MKCLCGYEKREPFWGEAETSATYFKSGPKKGQLKEPAKTKKVWLNPDDDKPFFRRVFSENELDFIASPKYDWDDPERVDLFACPECGTVKLG